jgi:hemimethylated DNA binding protein
MFTIKPIHILFKPIIMTMHQGNMSMPIHAPSIPARDSANRLNIWLQSMPQPNGFYFGQAPYPRIRSRNVAFAVGQKVNVKGNPSMCVIIGCDFTVQAPQLWISQRYSTEQTGMDPASIKKKMNMAHYRLLCANDGNNVAYVAQDDLELPASLSGHLPIVHPNLIDYFHPLSELERAGTNNTYKLAPELTYMFPGG